MSADDGKVKSHRPIMATIIRRGAVFIILGWLAITVLLTVKVPPLEIVEREHSVSLSPPDAPSVKAMTQMGKVFQESNSESVAVIVLEGEGTLGDDAHKYYDAVIRQLKDDPKHVQHVQDFWGDPLTAGAAQSADGKAAYVQLNLTGRFGQADANESVEAVQKVVRETPGLPPGVKAYVTGPAAIVSDMAESGNRTVILITLVSVGVIFLMLLLLYRSIITVIILLFTVGIELQVARGLVAFLGMHGIVGLTTFVVNLLVSVGIAAGTDYGIFFAGRYQEARQSGEDRESAYYTAYKGVAKVVLASGLTIAGAIACLHFTRLPLFQATGYPRRGRHFGGGCGGADLGPGLHRRRQSFRTVRPEATGDDASVAAGRYRDRAVARAHPRCDGGGCPDRIVDAARIQPQLHRCQVHPAGHTRDSGTRRRLAALPGIEDVHTRHPADRSQSRYAQLG